jgi:hypothetical protein
VRIETYTRECHVVIDDGITLATSIKPHGVILAGYRITRVGNLYKVDTTITEDGLVHREVSYYVRAVDVDHNKSAVSLMDILKDGVSIMTSTDGTKMGPVEMGPKEDPERFDPHYF